MNKTVVLIDSQLTARRMLHFAMTMLEHRVVEVVNPVDLLAELADCCPDLLVIGINAGDSGQAALLGELRQQAEFADLPILLVGESQLRTQWDPRTIGNCVWLNKPVRLNELHDMVENLLGSASLPPVCCQAVKRGRKKR